MKPPSTRGKKRYDGSRDEGGTTCSVVSRGTCASNSSPCSLSVSGVLLQNASMRQPSWVP